MISLTALFRPASHDFLQMRRSEYETRNCGTIEGAPVAPAI
ncbi:hypothetical protein CES86_4252 [Brucella lupini]|uniref:Uncharacterized protein n=1 Tax=Brucella lupini TaxID=255457 RepID=A0A256GEK8_9HYPH|nr:hypothetical protein CES86_4252 [Brucella lupini]